MTCRTQPYRALVIVAILLLVMATLSGCRSRSEQAPTTEAAAVEVVAPPTEAPDAAAPESPTEMPDEAAPEAPAEAVEAPAAEETAAVQPATEAPAASGAELVGACNHPYYPIRDGAVYRYQMTAPGMDAAEMTIAFTVTGADSFVTTQTFSGVTTETTWQCTEGGLLRTDLGLGIPEMPGLEYSVDGVTGVTFPPPDQLTEGATWQNTFNMSGQMSMEGLSLNVSMEALTDNLLTGFESVTTPAGTYDAARIEATTTMQITTDMGAMPAIPAMDTTTTMWLAEGVGMVKSVSADPMGGESTMELVALE